MTHSRNLEFRTFFGFLVLAILFLSACRSGNAPDTGTEGGTTVAEDYKTPAVMMPAFALKDAAGKRIDLSDMKGKRIFVNLWATWCPPCVKEMPSISKLYAQVKDSNVAFVMLSMDEDPDDALTFVRNMEFSMPVFFPDGDLPGLFNVPGIPATFIFDEEGKLIYRHTGMANYDQPKFVQMLTGK